MENRENYDITGKISDRLDSAQWGSIVEATEECPGVFYLATKDDDCLLCRELYAVTAEAIPQIISHEACTYGRENNGLYLFEYGVEGSGWELIQYEVERYRVKRGFPVGQDTIYSTAAYTADLYPNYFGGVIPPRCTPDGMVLRVKKAAEGIFFLETERCHWLMAVSFPIWDCTLSEFAQSLGRTCNQDLPADVKEAEYLYFTEEDCAPAVYELLNCREYGGIMDYLSSRAALETKLNLQFPEYVLEHNILEMSGHGMSDMLSNLLSVFGCEPPAISEEEMKKDQERRIANCIHLFPEYENHRLWNLP